MKPLKEVTKTDAIAELLDLQEDLAKYGRCMSEHGSCAYVQDDHPGCAIGRRLDEDEKAYILEKGAHVNESTNVEALGLEGCMPRYFENWNMNLLKILQEVHDAYNPENMRYIGMLRKYFKYVENEELNHKPGEMDHDYR